MNPLPSGVLLPSGILQTPWFAVFGLFVAFNTIIYLGLTAAKIVPWPRQVQPREVRRLTPIAQGDWMPHPTLPARAIVDDSARSLRENQAASTIPLAMALVGALSTAVGLLYVVLYLEEEGPNLIVGPVYGLVLIVLSLLLARRRPRPRVSIWIWTLLMVGFIAETSWRAAVIDSAVPLAFSIVALGFAAPISLSWGAGVFAAVAGALPIIVAGAEVSIVDTLSWALASVSAALSSLVLLYLRIASLDQIDEEQQRANSLASTDTRTGTFSRAGLIALAPTLAEAAAQSNTPISVIACRLPNLSAINASYGFDYGGTVLATTARALRASLPERALVARWGGNEFLAVMTGETPPPAELQQRVKEGIDTSGIALGKAAVDVEIGSATGIPGATTLEALVAEAEDAVT